MNSSRWTRRRFLGGSAATLGILGSPWRALALSGGTRVAADSMAFAGVCPSVAATSAAAVTLPIPVTRPIPLQRSNVARPLRYTLREAGFHIANGRERFNRPLYAALGNPGVVEAGDLPEFRLALPMGSGHLRLALAHGASAPRSLTELAEVSALYTRGGMQYTLRDPDLLGRHGELLLEVLSAQSGPGLHLALSGRGLPSGLTLHGVFRAARPAEPVSTRRGELRLGLPAPMHEQRPEDCAGFSYKLEDSVAIVSAGTGSLSLRFPSGASLQRLDAARWSQAWAELGASASGKPDGPHILFSSLRLGDGGRLDPQHVAITPATSSAGPSTKKPADAATPEALFALRRKTLTAVADRVRIRTPDPWLDAAISALNIAADALWSADTQSLVAAGGEAAASPGWSAPPGLDALGSHEHVQAHLRHWLNAQNTSPLPPGVDPDGPAAGPADPGSSLTRKSALLHSNGDLGHGDRDSTLGLLEAVIRHLRWTGDLAFAREIWPAFLRGVDWQYRLFRRQFDDPARHGATPTAALALYESYGALAADDSRAYNGAGVTHSTARNLFLNREAAVLARVLGEDAVPFDTEATLLADSMRRLLWQPDRGCFAEARDTLFPQTLSSEPGLWTATRVLDAECVTPREAWQITAERLAALAPIPVRGAGVPENNGPGASPFLLASSTWQIAGAPPDAGAGVASLLFAESVRFALALWQAGQPDAASALLRGCVLDAAARGLVPGNLHATSSLDPLAGETGIDAADSVGALARALVEGLFGVLPDLLRATLTIRPGFPGDWTEAELHHPEIDLAWTRNGIVERFAITSRLPHPVALTLLVPARATSDPEVLSNGIAFPSHFDSNATGSPRLILTDFPPATAWNVEIRWHGRAPLAVPERANVLAGESIPLPRGALSMQVDDPQSCLSTGAAARPGHHAAFLRVVDQNCGYWLPLPLTIVPVSVSYGAPPGPPANGPGGPSEASGSEVSAPRALATLAVTSEEQFQPIPLGALLDNRITAIVSRSYHAPRSPFCSLAQPEHLLDAASASEPFAVDDSGLRSAGGTLRTLANIPFATPAASTAPNCRFLSFWDCDRDAVELTLSGRASTLYLLLASTTTPQASAALHGTVCVRYTDGSESRLPLRPVDGLWPIDRDLFFDDFAFRLDPHRPLAPRVDLRTGETRMLDAPSVRGQGGPVPGGAAAVLHLPLHPDRELAALRVECSLYGVVLALLAATLGRPPSS